MQHAPLHLRRGKHRIVGGDADVAAHRQLHAAGETEAMHGRDHRLGHLQPHVEAVCLERLPFKRTRRQRAMQELKIRTGGESAIARATHHDHPDVVVRIIFLQAGRNLLIHLAGHGVQLVRPVEGHIADAVAALHRDVGLVRHGLSVSVGLMPENARPLSGSRSVSNSGKSRSYLKSLCARSARPPPLLPVNSSPY
jgi:hypothetical protein